MPPLTTAITIIAIASSESYRPTLPLGILLAWWICNSRKRRPVGGWPLFYYWQLYGGLLASVGLFFLNLQSYVPENFDSPSTFALSLISSVPELVLLFAQGVVATFLLIVRTWDMLRLLRWVILAYIGAGILGVGIDAVYFPDNLPPGVLATVQELIWLTYFFRSLRVTHIFELQDWDAAVDSIHPQKLKLAT